jgi:hypothetical protein
MHFTLQRRDVVKHLLMMTAVLSGISACGGGAGGESTPGPSLVSAMPATPLGAYLGNWVGACDFHAVDFVTITRPAGSVDSISISYQTNYHANVDCSGPVLGTWTRSASANAVYGGTVDASILFDGGSAAVPARVDKVTTSLPQHTWSVTGIGVVHSVVNGLAQWCIDYPSGGGSCIMDEGIYSGFIVNPAGLYIKGNVMYELRLNGSVYMENRAYIRK